MNGYLDFAESQPQHQQQQQQHQQQQMAPAISSTGFIPPPQLNRSSSSSSSVAQYSSSINVPYTYLQSHLGASSYRGYLHDIKPSINGLGHGNGEMSSTPGSGSDSSMPVLHQPVIGGIGKKKASATKRVGHAHAGELGKGVGEPRKKRSKRSSGKACVYCRRSHMVCEGGRPCERCIKREIPHLCRDFTPPPHPQRSHSAHTKSEVPTRTASPQLELDDTLAITQPQLIHTQSLPNIAGPPQQSQQSQQPQQNAVQDLYTDPNFPPSWPILPNAPAQMAFNNTAQPAAQTVPGSSTQSQLVPRIEQNDLLSGTDPLGQTGWDGTDESELAALNKFMKDLGVPSLPGDFFSFMNQMDGDSSGLQVPLSDLTNAPVYEPAQPSALGGQSSNNGFSIPSANAKGKGKVVPISRIDKFMMAAADQPNGTRASRLAQVIKAKYDAGLLKPYDYVKGYERMNKWMESGRAAPKYDSRAGSETPGSPARGLLGLVRNGRSHAGTPAANNLGKSISPESRRRILSAIAGFRPKFRQIAQTLTNVDLVFVEEAMERWMLEYDRAFASIHTPSCIWRRTGEIQKANQEFSNLTGIPASMFRDGQLCVYELMDEESAVRYWEGYAKIAFDTTQRSMSIACTLHIPSSLARHKPRYLTAAPSSHIVKSAYPAPPATPDNPPQGLYGEAPSASASDAGAAEEYREIKCCFSVTIRRDAWGVPVAIMGQWIPMSP
ncbi:hypothetical protein IAU60_002479 [Kwoniella sp. DSM 27419]